MGNREFITKEGHVCERLVNAMQAASVLPRNPLHLRRVIPMMAQGMKWTLEPFECARWRFMEGVKHPKGFELDSYMTYVPKDQVKFFKGERGRNPRMDILEALIPKAFEEFYSRKTGKPLHFWCDVVGALVFCEIRICLDGFQPCVQINVIIARNIPTLREHFNVLCERIETYTKTGVMQHGDDVDLDEEETAATVPDDGALTD